VISPAFCSVPATMVTKHLEVAFERDRRDAAHPQRTLEIAAAVETLSSHRDLNAIEQQVKSRGRRLCKSVGVERPRGKRKAHHKHRGYAVIPFCKATELSLGLRVEVIHEVGAPEALQAFGECPDGHIQHRWQRRGPIPFEQWRVLGVESVEEIRARR
jgi:hypothetical protein